MASENLSRNRSFERKITLGTGIFPRREKFYLWYRRILPICLGDSEFICIFITYTKNLEKKPFYGYLVDQNLYWIRLGRRITVVDKNDRHII